MAAFNIHGYSMGIKQPLVVSVIKTEACCEFSERLNHGMMQVRVSKTEQLSGKVQRLAY